VKVISQGNEHHIEAKFAAYVQLEFWMQFLSAGHTRQVLLKKLTTSQMATVSKGLLCAQILNYNN
jgi:hypothetical protein